MTRTREIFRRDRVLSADERKEIRAKLSEYLAIKKRMAEIDQESLCLYDERDELAERGADIAPDALARHYGVSGGAIRTLIKRRDHA